MDDEKLILRIKSGDTDALDTLIQKHYDDIYTYCYRRLGNQLDAQDVTQDVFLHFCRDFDAYTNMGKCKNYLYVIAHNLCINTMQKKKPISLEDAKEEMSSGIGIPAERFEEAGPVQAALKKLPQEQKEVVILRFYHDLKLREIAQITNSRLSTTKYRLGQGLKTLSKLLSKEDRL